jgi:hypothetical protein
MADEVKAAPKVAASNGEAARNFDRSLFRRMNGQEGNFQGLQVWHPVDPYSGQQRKEFRSAMTNPYVYRASRIQCTYTAGQGYTTEIVPRHEEDVPEEQLNDWQRTQTYHIPYFDKDMTAEQLLDKVDKLALDLDLPTNLFNGYFTALEQGRCVLALTPLDPDEQGNWQLPEQIRLIRSEFTERPVLDDNTGELVGVRIIGVRSQIRDNIIPAERMLYLMHGFNNELFSDYYGDSKIARVSDEANTLNIVLNQDFERAAESAWYKPPVFSVPIPPQEAGNEDDVLASFINKINDSKGQAIAVTGPSNPEETGVNVLTTPVNADIGGLEIVRMGLIKAIITAFGLPGFMLSEGDIGKLGGNANIEEVDAYLNQEIRPERIILENSIEKQFYDRVLCILFQEKDARKLPCKIKFKFNKPKLLTLVTPDMFQVLTGMAQMGLIDSSGIKDILGLEDLDKDSVSKGSQGGADPMNNKLTGWRQPVQINLWEDSTGKMNMTAADWVNSDQWNKVDIRNKESEVDREIQKHEWEVADKKAEWSNGNTKEAKKDNKEKKE